MDAIDLLVAAIDKSGMKHNRIAEDAGMKPGKFSKILNRKQAPTIHEYLAIAQAMHLDPARLFTDRELVVELQALRDAQAASQRVYELLTSWLPESPVAAPVAVAIPKPPPRREMLPVRSAANPNAELPAEFEKPRRIPDRAWRRGARLIARVVGDSMDGGRDPLHDGDLAYLKPTRSPRTVNGHIALVRRDEGLLLKLFEMSGHKIRLVSTNDYDALELDARGENMQIYGYVVDHGREEER